MAATTTKNVMGGEKGVNLTAVAVGGLVGLVGLVGAIVYANRASEAERAVAALKTQVNQQTTEMRNQESKLDKILVELARNKGAPSTPSNAQQEKKIIGAEQWTCEETVQWIESVVGTDAYKTYFENTNGLELVDLIRDCEHGFSFGDKCFFMGVARDDCVLLERAGQALV